MQVPFHHADQNQTIQRSTSHHLRLWFCSIYSTLCYLETQWEKLDMSSMERRKLACSVTFHAVAFTCVIWSLYVLIDRSAEEYNSGQLQWPFWTKLVVVAIGFTGTYFLFPALSSFLSDRSVIIALVLFCFFPIQAELYLCMYSVPCT